MRHLHTTAGIYGLNMLRKLILGITLCLLSASTAMADVKKIVTGNEQFGKTLYNLVAQKDGNIIMSQFSAHFVLSMAYAGAAGSTAEAFRTVLGVHDAETTADEYHELMTSIQKLNSNITLNLANKIFVMKSFGLNPAFQAILSKKYDAAAQELDFNKNVESAQTINTWVESKTNDKIKDLIKPDMLDGLTRLVLVNAVYFKGNWADQFNRAATKEEPFYLLDGTEVKCNMMHNNGKYRYSESELLNSKILELPYQGEEMSMLIFLPHERDGLKHLESTISQFDFANYDRNMGKWEVDVSLPRFKIESEIPLTKFLKETSLKVIFSDDADFSKIPEKDEKLKVSEVIQKAYIEVNEEGAEAAAATGMVIVGFSMPRPLRHITFKADQPFLFKIVRKESEYNYNIIFSGRVLNPLQ